MRILVTGSRDWTNAVAIEHALRHRAVKGAVLVHGNCRGADIIAATIWRRLGLKDEPHPADWSLHGKAAGFIRNREMVNSGIDLCLAFIKNFSRGATNCAELADERGIRTEIFRC
jgi:hypothetical protein